MQSASFYGDVRLAPYEGDISDPHFESSFIRQRLVDNANFSSATVVASKDKQVFVDGIQDVRATAKFDYAMSIEVIEHIP